MNSDGASLGNPEKVGGGGLIRDDLILASQLGITQLLVELDAKVVVDLVLSRKPSNNPYSSLLNNCRFLLNQFQQVRVNHAFREANCCADSLAKGGCYLLEDFVVLELPPNDSSYVLLNSNASG